MKFESRFTDVNVFRTMEHRPDFENLRKVLQKKAPDRPTLFEFLLGPHVVEAFTEGREYSPSDPLRPLKKMTDTYYFCGYDFACIYGSDFSFVHNQKKQAGKNTKSINDNAVITDWESFEKYRWNDPEAYDYSRIPAIGSYMREGMKLLIPGPGGVLENAISLVGYENLCLMLYDEPELVQQIFHEIGSRLLRYYAQVVEHEEVGAVMLNDDWGFHTQTMLSTAHMRELVFPWHRKMAALAHEHGKLVCLHSCGRFAEIADDIACDMKHDGRHSYEDKILPVEEAYEKYRDHFAILGGIDVDYLCRRTPEEIFARARRLVEQGKTGYALGSGNSIAPYIPLENYLAMIAAAVFAREG